MRKRTNPITILENCTGVNNALAPTRIDTADLQQCVNAVVTESGRVERAVGHTLVMPLTGAHSVHKTYSNHRYVCDEAGSMYLFNKEYDTSEILSGLSGNRVRFCDNGNETYYCNGQNIGILFEGVGYAWEASTYHGPDTSRVFETEIPKFDFVVLLNKNRMFGVKDNSLFESEVGDFGLWDLSKSFTLPTKIIEVIPFSGGLIVSDEKSMWRLRGTSLDDFEYKEILNYPALSGAVATNKVLAEDIGIDEVNSICSIFNSSKGLCTVTDSGAVINLVRNKILYPTKGTRGASVVAGFYAVCVVEEEYCTYTSLKIGNPGDKATTNLSGYSFNSFFVDDDNVFACDSSGVYLLGGDTFSGADIDAYFYPRTLNFSSKTNVEYMYIDVLNTNSLSIGITPNVDGTDYPTLTAAFATGGTHLRVKLGKGLNGSIWKFKISNVNGEDFSIEKISILPNAKSRIYPT